MTKSINGFTVAALTATQAAIINNARANAPGANDPRADERKQIKREVFSIVKAKYGIPESTKLKANTTGVDQPQYLVLHDEAGNAFQLDDSGRWNGVLLNKDALFPSAPVAQAFTPTHNLTPMPVGATVFDAPRATAQWVMVDMADVKLNIDHHVDDAADDTPGDLPTPHLMLCGSGGTLAIDADGVIWRKL